MTSCPSEQDIAGLLADALGASARDAAAQHIQRCATCQAKLAQLTEADGAVWRRAQHHSQASDGEEKIIQRLKGKPHWSPSSFGFDPLETPRAESLGKLAARAGIDAPPDVPGYEILGLLG